MVISEYPLEAAKKLMKSDETLLLEFQQGSREAFSEIYGRYRAPIDGFFRRRMANAGRAEELSQDVFLAVIHGSQRYEPRSQVRTYLFGIAMKILMAERRKANRQVPLSDFEFDCPDAVVAPTPENAYWVKAALCSLEASDREIVMLREYEQLSYEEIAALLKLPLNTVRSRLFRARQELRKLLEMPRPVARVREA